MTALYHFLHSVELNKTVRSVKFRLHVARVLVLLATIINTWLCVFCRAEKTGFEFAQVIVLWVMAGVANVSIAQTIVFLDEKVARKKG